MTATVTLFFNFRSPYCYLASFTMFDVLEKHGVDLRWRPLGGWDGRSSPDRAKVKIPSTRQDVARWCKRMKVPFVPPPTSTEPTLAGMASLLAEERGLLRAWTEATMQSEWGHGNDIGDPGVLHRIGEKVGISAADLDALFADPGKKRALSANWEEAERLGVIGVPTFVVGDQIFWGNDRLDFLDEHLTDLSAAR